MTELSLPQMLERMSLDGLRAYRENLDFIMASSGPGTPGSPEAGIAGGYGQEERAARVSRM